MPELPDLQVFARNLNKLFKGKTLEKVEVPHSKKLNVSIEQLKDALEGAKLHDVRRVGKELHFAFNNKHVLGQHLMLHGEFRLFDGENKHKSTIIELHFKGEQGLAITDFQGAATPTLDPEEKDAPDALDVEKEYLMGKLAKTKKPVKTVLMDQKVLRGIGNAYADEILWDAKISPFSISNKLPEEVVSKLIKSIKEVLEDAEKQIIKSNPDLISGEVRDFLKVHLPRQKQTATGATIYQKELNARKTYYTDEQELFE
ncbi:formamidopyrimidine-DNA glycosylase [Mucilaginibacter auburnensis]|uniref:Formamidopyrimidine-DNA glycosylase n=2 Tax=Mucilaginibacter auburnensis TaxID=1457233 RepID=A0A2H9VN10_9SPHI|nr:formamidopyrimidine-DNA glycosylase [Mucilaginibacter auburnensis]